MIQKMKQWKQKDNKGFTLVELIVVLVILAILAAILVPALLGYIDRAKQQQIVLNARSCYTAAQAEMSSMYGTKETPTNANMQAATSGTTQTHGNMILKTADVEAVCQELIIGVKDNTDHGKYTISYVKYTEGGKTIYFNGTSWVETAPTTTGTTYTIKAKSTT